MTRMAGILVIGALGLLGCEGQAPGRIGDQRAVAAVGLSTAGTGSANGETQESLEVVARRVWGQGGISLSGDVSQDGSELVFVDWETGDLSALDLRTRETRRITNKGSWEESGDYAWNAKLSRDGKRVAYTWAVQEGNTERYELRMIGMDGRGAYTVYRDESVGWIQPLAWFPGGDHLLAFISRQGGVGQLLQISVPGGDSRILRETDPGFPGMMALSPDGKALIFARAQGEESTNRDIFLTAAASNS